MRIATPAALGILLSATIAAHAATPTPPVPMPSTSPPPSMPSPPPSAAPSVATARAVSPPASPALAQATAELSAEFQNAYAAAEAAAMQGPAQLTAMKRIQGSYQNWQRLANAEVDAANQRAADLTKQLAAKDAEIARLNNALAAEKDTKTLKLTPGPAAPKFTITNDKGVPLMLDVPKQTTPEKKP